jgi:hypothetical protein
MRLIRSKKQWIMVGAAGLALGAGLSGISAARAVTKRRALCHSVAELSLPALDRTIKRLAAEARASHPIIIAVGNPTDRIR